MQKISFSSCMLFLLFFSCTSAPIKRMSPGFNKGVSTNNFNRQMQNPKNMGTVKKKLALLDFYNESPFGQEDLAFVATEEFRKEISMTPDFVIEPLATSVFGNSKEVYSGGGVKFAQLAKKAKQTGVNLVVYGRITHARVRQKLDEIGFVRKNKSYAESVLEVRVFDVHSNKEIFIQKMDGNITDSNFKFFMEDRADDLSYRRELLRYSIKVAIRRFTPKFIQLGEKLDWTGRVARILGSKVYINSGKQSGLQVGDVLRVFTEGSDIFDPETGAHIGVSQGEVKGTLEITDYFGTDGAIANLHSGGTVTEGDLVQLY